MIAKNEFNGSGSRTVDASSRKVRAVDLPGILCRRVCRDIDLNRLSQSGQSDRILWLLRGKLQKLRRKRGERLDSRLSLQVGRRPPETATHRTVFLEDRRVLLFGRARISSACPHCDQQTQRKD